MCHLIPRNDPLRKRFQLAIELSATRGEAPARVSWRPKYAGTRIALYHATAEINI